MPAASIIMPCFNHGRFVEESTQAILGQTYADLELIIVDDCSTDSSWAVIQTLARKDPRIRAIRHEINQGAARSRNDGMRFANGEFIGFCDADDVWETTKLERQTNLLQNHPEFDVTYGDSIIIDEHGAPTGERFSHRFRPPHASSGWLFPRLLTRNFVNMQTVLMRRECFHRMGGFAEDIKWVEDWSYWITLSHAYRFLYKPAALSRYRVHAHSSNIVQRRSAAFNRIKVLRRILRTYPGLPLTARADILRNIGGELYDLGKPRAGRRLLWRVVGLIWPDPRTALCRARAFLRILRPARD